MADASDTIRRKRQRTLYASKVIQQEYYEKGYTNRVLYEGTAPGGQGSFILFDGTYKIYAAGGTGGTPNTAVIATAAPNTGTGGVGTGATLNSFANGNQGASGIVILKWYT